MDIYLSIHDLLTAHDPQGRVTAVYPPADYNEELVGLVRRLSWCTQFRIGPPICVLAAWVAWLGALACSITCIAFPPLYSVPALTPHA